MLDQSVINKWVNPFYLSVLHGNYATSMLENGEGEVFNKAVLNALAGISPDVVSELIGGHWREAMVGSWFAGLKGFTECRQQIGECLIKSEITYAGQSHAFAMACFSDEESADFLERYLNEFLSQKDCLYDQDWAMPALMWIDQECGTNRSQYYLQPGGLWEFYTADKIRADGAWTIEHCKKSFWQCMIYCRQHFQNTWSVESSSEENEL